MEYVSLLKSLTKGFHIAPNISSQGSCETPGDLRSLLLSGSDQCLREEAPTWKYLPQLVNYYHHIVQSLWPCLVLLWHHLIEFCRILAGCASQLRTFYSFYSEVLQHDHIFMFSLKFCGLLLFLFVMHWIRQGMRESKPSSGEAANVKDRNTRLPNGRMQKCSAEEDLTPHQIICEFEFKTPAELQAAAEAVQDVDLELEEKKRRKRISKKRKCVSAGPILIHIRQVKKRKNPAPAPPSTKPYTVTMLPPEKDREMYLPLRSTPLAVGEMQRGIIVNHVELEVEEAEILAYMCVYI